MVIRILWRPGAPIRGVGDRVVGRLTPARRNALRPYRSP